MSKKSSISRLGDHVRIRTGKLDANASSIDGAYPFFTCSQLPLRISSFSYDCECVLIAGNGDLNVKYYDGKFDAYQRTYIVESLDKTKLDTRYLFYWMSVYVERLREMSVGGVIKYIKLGYLTEAQLPLPSLEEQRRIAAILDKTDELRAKRRASLEKISALGQSLFAESFGNLKTNPKAFEIAKLSDLCTRITDGTHQPPGWSMAGIPFLFVSNIVDGEIDFQTEKFISEETHKELMRRCPIEVNDILYTTVGSYGNAALVKSSKKFAFQRHIAHLKPDQERIDPKFLSVMLQSPDVQHQADRFARGVAQKTINLNELNSFVVFKPPLEVQKEFVNRVYEIERLKGACRASLRKLDELFDSLQHRAFRGEL